MTKEPGSLTNNALARRQFLKRAATVTWATPLVLTMSARHAGAQALSCIPPGTPCNACEGMKCCAVAGGNPDGCCCSPVEVPRCEGVCTADEASCQALHVEDTLAFQCYVPLP